MEIQRKRYWLRGGLIATTPVTLLGISIAFSMLATIREDDCGDMGCKSNFALLLLIFWIIIFGLGAFFGWLYGKVKSKKLNKP